MKRGPPKKQMILNPLRLPWGLKPPLGAIESPDRIPHGSGSLLTRPEYRNNQFLPLFPTYYIWLQYQHVTALAQF